jgi:hypothetical protein
MGSLAAAAAAVVCGGDKGMLPSSRLMLPARRCVERAWELPWRLDCCQFCEAGCC